MSPPSDDRATLKQLAATVACHSTRVPNVVRIMNASCVLSFLPKSRCASIANNIIQIAHLSPSGRMHGTVTDRDNLISGPILVGSIIQRTIRGAMVVAQSPKQPRQRHRANLLEGLRHLFPLSHLKLVSIKTDIDESHNSIGSPLFEMPSIRNGSGVWIRRFECGHSA